MTDIRNELQEIAGVEFGLAGYVPCVKPSLQGCCHALIMGCMTNACLFFVQFADLHLEMRGGKLGLDFTQFDSTISSTGECSGISLAAGGLIWSVVASPRSGALCCGVGIMAALMAAPTSLQLCCLAFDCLLNNNSPPPAATKPTRCCCGVDPVQMCW